MGKTFKDKKTKDENYNIKLLKKQAKLKRKEKNKRSEIEDEV